MNRLSRELMKIASGLSEMERGSVKRVGSYKDGLTSEWASRYGAISEELEGHYKDFERLLNKFLGKFKKFCEQAERLSPDVLETDWYHNLDGGRAYPGRVSAEVFYERVTRTLVSCRDELRDEVVKPITYDLWWSIDGKENMIRKADECWGRISDIWREFSHAGDVGVWIHRHPDFKDSTTGWDILIDAAEVLGEMVDLVSELYELSKKELVGK